MLLPGQILLPFLSMLNQSSWISCCIRKILSHSSVNMSSKSIRIFCSFLSSVLLDGSRIEVFIKGEFDEDVKCFDI